METENYTLTQKQAADFMAISPITLQKWRCQRKGPLYSKLGRSVRYLRKDLIAYLEDQRVSFDLRQRRRRRRSG